VRNDDEKPLNNIRTLKFVIILSACCSLYVLAPSLAFAGVSTTRHNLSISGPGPAQATEETGICKFCHTPHNASPASPLWNHEVTEVTDYIHYWSPTLVSYASAEAAPPIDGFSRLCLSCHDGTVALGALVNRGELIETVPEFLTFGMEGYLGTDLSGGHPISIIFDQSLANRRNTEPDVLHLNWPLADKDVKLYPTQGGFGVQCSSCHDPHGGKGGPEAPPFWRKETYDDVCLVCHDASPAGTGH
jgi:predicted CXXCH cytochrome family protein